MDALLVTFLACLLCESGGASHRLATGLSARFARTGFLILGLGGAAAANAVPAAWGGAYLAGMMAPDARSLFLAIALFLGGAGLLLPVRQPDMLEGWRTGALATAFFGMAILMFGNAAQFIVIGMAVRTGDPLWSAIGGTLGMTVACIPAIVPGQQALSATTMRHVRRAGGALLLFVGTTVGLSALHLL